MAEKSRMWLFVLIIIVVLFFISMFIAGIIAFFFGGVDTSAIRGSVALIPIKGVIMADKSFSYFGEQVLSSTETMKMIEKAEKNENIKAIVFEINSPGGSAVASEEIANAVLKAEKPTIAWIRETGTSGSYWVASSADYVIANRMSIVGSIGVISSYLEFSGLLKDYNVTYQRLVAGKYKDIGSPFKEMGDDEKLLFKERLDEIHNYFVDAVVKNRKLSKKSVDDISTGLFYTGAEAMKIGLVDEIGGKDEVTAYLEKKYGIKAEYIEYKKKRTFFESLSEVFSSFSFYLGEGVGKGMFNKKDLKIYAE